MSNIDAYGDFELPEEKSAIEVVEDPVKVVVSSYDLFRKLAEEKILKGYRTWFSVEKTKESLYECTLKLFEGKEELKIEGTKAFECIKEKTDELNDGLCGIFLSALHNATKTDNLVVYHDYKNKLLRFFGYKLQKNKTLIIDPSHGKLVEDEEIDQSRGKLWNVGELCEGYIINNGRVDDLASNAKDGVQINFNYAGSLSSKAKGGLQLNLWGVESFAYNVFGGMQINFYLVERCANESSGGIQINAGNIINKGDIKSHFILNFGKNRGLGSICLGIPLVSLNYISKKNMYNKYPSFRKLENKLEEAVDFLLEAKEQPNEEMAKLIRKYDWKIFEEEVTALSEQLKKEDFK